MNELTGTGNLIRLILRRDRIWLPIWVLLPMLVTWGQVSFVMALPDWREFVTEMIANPLTGAILGPVMPVSVAGAIIWRSAVQGAMVLAIASLLTMIRHTRTEEESGRTEMIRGGVVGRYANLTAALALTCAASLIAGLLAALTLIAAGLPSGGALIFGITIAASGWFFAGVGALAAQLRDGAGDARSLALALFGVGFLAYVWNNLEGGYTGWAWLAPHGWYRLTQPFAGNHGEMLLVLTALSAIPVAGAYALSTRRDFGGGLLSARLGPANASPALHSPLALAWRLHKGAIKVWTAGLVFVGAGIGAGAPSVAEGISDMLANMGTGAWTERLSNREGFIAVVIYVLALLIGVTVYGINTLLRLRKEETESRAELILVQPVGRLRWMAGHLIIALSGSAFLLLALGLSVGLGWGLVAGDVGGVLPLVLGMSLSKIPAVWVMVGITAMLYGLVPRLSNLIWGIWALFVVIEMLWEIQVVDWSAMRLSPFSYVHYSIPISELPFLPLLGLTCLAAALTAAGLLGFRRRDMG
ncbi:MAG: ABC transporter permease [Chloroflexota bacterium]|jgi:ABC-2 type transport system permease protein